MPGVGTCTVLRCGVSMGTGTSTPPFAAAGGRCAVAVVPPVGLRAAAARLVREGRLGRVVVRLREDVPRADALAPDVPVVRLPEVRLVDARLVEVRPPDVRLAEVRPPDVRLGDVRLLVPRPPEVLAAEVLLAAVVLRGEQD